MPNITISDERVVGVVLPMIKRIFKEAQAQWNGPGFGLCMKVATIVMQLMDEATDATSPGGAEAKADLQRNAARIAKSIFDALAASGGPMN